MVVKVKKISENAIVPSKMTSGSAGYDLYSNEFITIFPGTRLLIHTGISLELPEGYEAQIRPRSGLALKYGITVLNTPATIDSDYRGEIQVLLINLGSEKFTIDEGMRIAQLVISKCESTEFEVVNELTESKRSSNGFGSTGIK